MKYTYAYKTSDGVRHEDAMDASSREEVFVALRARGIRAIKVVAEDGSKANGEWEEGRSKREEGRSRDGATLPSPRLRRAGRIFRIAFSFLVLAAAGAGAYFIANGPGRLPQAPAGRKAGMMFTTEQSRAAYTNLEAQAARIIAEHKASMATLRLDILTNYKLIEGTQDRSVFVNRIKSGYRAIDNSRASTRELFKSIFTIFPAECANERAEAQRMYAETMDILDVSESRLANDEKAYRMLDSNRGRWHSHEDSVIWQDRSLANEFEYLRHDVDQSALRWMRDFDDEGPAATGNPKK